MMVMMIFEVVHARCHELITIEFNAFDYGLESDLAKA